MLISVCMITYGQEKYIRQSIIGVLTQKVTFEIELIIADDCSPDKTKDIVDDIIRNHSNGKWIKYSRHSKNKGMMQNFIWALAKCSGKYIALCEGDDYWINSLKLQKQVDFLEANDDYAICFHRVYELREGKEPKLSNLNTSLTVENYTIEDLAKDNFMHTPSVLFRNGLINEYPEWFKDSPVGDYTLHLLNCRYGKIHYLPDVMGIYRIHSNGIWSSMPIEYNYERWLRMLQYLIQEFDGNVKLILQKQYSEKAFYLSKIYQCNGDYNNMVKFILLGMVGDRTLDEKWFFENYIPLIKEVESQPKGIKSVFKYFLKELKDRTIYKISSKQRKNSN